MTARETQSGADRKNPDRRDFLRTLGAASLGLAAAGMTVPGAQQAQARPAGALLDPAAPLRIGMIGREGHLYVVFNSLNKVPGAKIVSYAFEDGAWDYRAEDGVRRTGKYDLEAQRKWCAGQNWYNDKLKLYETYQEMLDKEKLDLVVVGLPYARNAFASAAAAEHGVHVLCEKPVAVNYADLEMLDSAVKKSGVRLSAMFTMRYTPTLFTTFNALRNQAVGRIALARAQKSYKWGESRPWFYKSSEIYGSTILWVAIHAIDYIRWTTGLEVRKVGAFHGNTAHPDYPGCQDQGVVEMVLEGGATAAVTFDFLRPETAPTHGDDRLRVIGSDGVLETQDLDTRLELISREQGPHDLKLSEPPDELADLVGELRGQNRSLIGPDEAVRVTRICIAATQAANEGRVIEV
jgi:predicted dehydrogenase